MSWNAGSQSKDLSVYDASGNRVLRRTTMTMYAFGLEEHTYTLGGRLLSSLDNNNKTMFYLTDALGSFNNTANSAAIKGNQVYGPYGNSRDLQGSINTAKGFTAQYNDSLTGLDYYNSRYYDQVAGVFLSADSVQGNGPGANPYAYVSGNPETRNDPTGQMYAPPPSGGASLTTTVPTSQPQSSTQPSCGFWCGLTNVAGGVVHVVGTVADLATGFSFIKLPCLRPGCHLLTPTSLGSFMTIFSFNSTCYFSV